MSSVPHCSRAFFGSRRPDSRAVVLMMCLLDALCVALLQGVFVRRRPDSRAVVLKFCLLD